MATHHQLSLHAKHEADAFHLVRQVLPLDDMATAVPLSVQSGPRTLQQVFN
jgi:hypothetical protein